MMGSICLVLNHIDIPFIVGDGIGPGMSLATKMVLKAAVTKVYSKSRSMSFIDVMAGEAAYKATGHWLSESTLSIIGIDQEGHLRIVPMENNTYTKHNENDGVVLESLSMNLVKKLITIYKIPYIERPIAVEKA